MLPAVTMGGIHSPLWLAAFSSAIGAATPFPFLAVEEGNRDGKRMKVGFLLCSPGGGAWGIWVLEAMGKALTELDSSSSLFSPVKKYQGA